MIRFIRLWWLERRQSHAQGRRRHWARVDQRIAALLATIRGRG